MISKRDIYDYVKSHHESEYWDFKEYWYSNSADLIGDILNFANTSHHKDCYIIIGVTDDYNIIGVEVNDSKRRNTQNITDILKSANFESNIFPNVTVKSFQMEGKNVDVITIFDSSNVPFYLAKDYSKPKIKGDPNPKNRVILPAGLIYSRMEDTNTSKNKSASLSQMESLWRKRFGLDLTPGEKLIRALNAPDEWIRQADDKMVFYYHKFNPDFQIQIMDDDDKTLFIKSFSYNQEDKNIIWKRIRLVIGGTKIAGMQGAYLDGARYHTVVPDLTSINLTTELGHNVSYYYLIKGSIKELLYEFFYYIQKGSEEAKYSDSRFMETIVVVEDDVALDQLNNNLAIYFSRNRDEMAFDKLEVSKMADSLRNGEDRNFTNLAIHMLESLKVVDAIRTNPNLFQTDLILHSENK